MNYRIRNIHTWMIIQKCKQLGIECNFLVPDNEDFLELKKEGTSIVINRALSPFLRYIPHAITENKIICNHILQQNGFPIPEFIFADHVGDIELKFLEANSPIVAKPFDTNKGVEIHMNLSTEQELIFAIERIKLHSAKAILQKQTTGSDYRILLIDHQVEGVLFNEWPYIIGDGKSTIRELIEHENNNRITNKTNVYGKLTGMLVEIPLNVAQQALSSQGYNLNDIPKNKHKIYIGYSGNGWSGALSHDYTAMIHPEIAQKAIEITKFLDIDVAGLDIRCKDIAIPYKSSNFQLIEVNTRPSIVDHEFPTSGESQNVTEKYLDYLFKHNERVR